MSVSERFRYAELFFQLSHAQLKIDNIQGPHLYFHPTATSHFALAFALLMNSANSQQQICSSPNKFK